MDNIKDLLNSDRFAEPSEVALIKQYIQDKYRTDSQVTIQDTQIIIAVPSSALAGTLQMELPKIKELCKTDKKLLVRIGFRS